MPNYSKTFQGKIKFRNYETTYTMADIVNPDDIDIWSDCYVLLDGGFVLAIVFADCEQDALDESFDAGKLDAFKIEEFEEADYPDCEWVTFLGNNGTPCDIENVQIWPVKKPQVVFVFE